MLNPLYALAALLVLPVVPTSFETKKNLSDDVKLCQEQPYVVNLLTAQKNQAENQEVKMLKQNGWFNNVVKELQKKEYEFSRGNDSATYTTYNRKNNFYFHYNSNGFTVQPGTTKAPVGKMEATTTTDEIRYSGLPNWEVAFNLDRSQVGEGQWQINGNKAEYDAGNIVVQYINNENGLRQNFVVKQPLSKQGDLKLRFSVSTNLQQRMQKDRLQFLHKQSGVVLNYDQLKVWDANGRPLEAFFEKDNMHYCVHVQSKDAAYPITIDPLSNAPAAMIESNQDNANLGYSVSSAGDVNGDGYSDIIVGAYNYDNGQANEGAAFIYHGSSTGVSTAAAAMIEGGQDNANFGFAVSGAGDVNGDGFSDVIVGAPLYNNGHTDAGAAFVYHGSGNGINTTAATMLESNSNQNSTFFGFSVSGAGDVNGDGYSDVIVGVPLYDNGQTNEGVALIYQGSSTGISTVAPAMLESNQDVANLGYSVSGAGDVNGDGYSEVIVGSPLYDNGQTNEGVAFIYHGSSSGINTLAAAMIESNQDTANLGYSVSSAGDVNGDGYSDIIAGAYLYDNGQIDEGAVFVYHGSSGGINSTAAVMLESNQAGAYYGRSIACAGDVNGDGYSDIIAGAYLYDNGQIDEGAAFIYQGSAIGISSTTVVSLESNQAYASFGYSVSSAGDVNGDGYSDIITGAYLYDNGQTDEGSAFVYHGASSGIKTTAAAVLESNLNGANSGISVACAGDVNGDGYSDIIVGAFFYSNNQGAALVYHGSSSGISTTAAAIMVSNQTVSFFGWSVSGAGDVNGDGYGDIIVGADHYDNGLTDAGRAYIYYGSSTGINTTAPVIVEGDQNTEYFGTSVSSAGDVNGDGYSDVIVGATNYDNGQTNEGAAFIYYGSSAGINTTTAARIEGNRASGGLGSSVSGAGDVNGDGYSDIIVGAGSYNNGQIAEGVVFIYHGSATGINTTAATMLEYNQASALFGWSVSGAGDVNGDGYSDVIVGAKFYDNGQTNEGAAFIYHGSSFGVNTTAAAILEINQDNAYTGGGGSQTGRMVSGAGDVNGDGYGDIVVGANGYDNGQTNEGGAFVYHGSPTGIQTTAAAMLESNQGSASFGASVCGGDVNGDGYSDVIVGAHQYSNGQTNEGAVFVYNGNSAGNNMRNNMDLYNTDLNTPINSSNFSNTNFGTGLFARSFLGNQQGKLVWETRVSYNAYSGTPITNSVVFTSAQNNYSSLGVSGIALKNVVAKVVTAANFYTKIRTRVKYNPVTAITGQVYGPWRYVPDQAYLSIVPLPLHITAFNTQWLRKGVTAQVKFSVDEESDVCCYIIEKSSSGFDFKETGKLNANNTGGAASYNFTDINAIGLKLYYRIKIVFTNGNIEYSNISLLQNISTTEIIVFPNPAANELCLLLNKNYTNMNVQIVNSTGQMVKQLNNVLITTQKLTIPVINLKPGMYFMYLQSGDEKQVLQFMKQ
ncbi:T9SS type A sorting domain-containing protein [Niastella caeni]|uniref:T9SS type A sorting domain-containing protein n=1 Tax=Niastella caeni TaxID=2569763 RepID=A0A4S8HKR0_9BACT|nr:FG-GAP-like repeat-containing protein [Niastella caeni]THU35797.1 T9SS type A sorting domain-containing protein [Niastella caeni]